MVSSYWNGGYFGWGWLLWFGFILLLMSSFGNWGYTYRAHRRVSGRPDNRAFDILDERYARGEITREEYGQLKSDIGSGSADAVENGRSAPAGRNAAEGGRAPSFVKRFRSRPRT